jgi:hypothetical protein
MLREVWMTDNRDDGMVPRDGQASLREEWKQAVEFEDLHPESVGKAFFLGRNIRVKLPDAFIAGYRTVMAGFSIADAFGSGGDWPKATLEAYVAAQSVFSALVEKMKPLEYVTIVILSQYPQGVDEGMLAEEVEKFLDSPNTRTFGWHLGMTEKRVNEARDDRYGGWIAPILRDLESKGFLSASGTTLHFKQKNVEWKFGV